MPGDRWQKQELETLSWLIRRKEQLRYEALTHGQPWYPEKWSWEAIATKMNKVADRDGWEDLRIYTASNCYTMCRNRKSLLMSSASTLQEYPQPTQPSSSSPQLPVMQVYTPATAPVQYTAPMQQFAAPVDHSVSALQYAAAAPAIPASAADRVVPDPPYHWTMEEREALKEIYMFSGIGREDNYTPGRRKGLWTWKMVAAEMNKRAAGASWNTGRTYNDGSCYQISKYNKTDFNSPNNKRGIGASCQPLVNDSE
ncbi:hypothetical protein B2J93_6993 [Marssonina coronariae]|uniref:Uncharacterized protein n=1 Tax=Diplocarpon coronariae TaxID=2795749 RepID=A0A218ZA79_9HELO|nr:hypothetical protein B2J93_6993 [Marssonina coronariae]